MKARFITRFRRSSQVGALLVAVVVGSGVLPGNAHAASEIGWNYPAQVACDSIANTIAVAPMFGAGDMYAAQSLGYRFWVKNTTTGGIFWLSAGGQWSSFYHHRVGAPYYDILGNWYPGVITPIAPIGWETFTITGPYLDNSRFYVYAQYRWYSPTRGWLTSGTYTTTSYANPGWGNLSYCLL